MTIPDDLRAWRDKFLADHGITAHDLVNPDYEPIEAECERRYDLAAQRIPSHYAAALTTEAGIQAWMAELLQQAITDRRMVCAITTGPSLLVLGPTGTGKTFQAYGVIRGLAACGITMRWMAISAADLYARLRPRHGIDGEAEFEKFAATALLVLDDLGVAKGSEWVEEVNYRLVNYRYEHGLPTLFTSNVPPRDLAGVLGERVASRLTEMAKRLSLKGTDRRRAA